MSEIRQLYEVINSVLNDIQDYYATHKTISSHQLSSLSIVFGSQLEAALELIDRSSVSLVTSASGYDIYSCRGTSGTPYYIPSGLTFCPCQSFRGIAGRLKEIPICKHILAVLLSRSMGTIVTKEVPDSTMEDILLEFNGR